MANYMNRKSKKVIKDKSLEGFKAGDKIRYGKKKGIISKSENEDEYIIFTVLFDDESGDERFFNYKGEYIGEDKDNDVDMFVKSIGVKLTVTKRYPEVAEGKYHLSEYVHITVQHSSHENDLTIFFMGGVQLDSVTKEEFYKSFFPNSRLLNVKPDSK